MLSRRVNSDVQQIAAPVLGVLFLAVAECAFGRWDAKLMAVTASHLHRAFPARASPYQLDAGKVRGCRLDQRHLRGSPVFRQDELVWQTTLCRSPRVRPYSSSHPR